MIQEYLGTVITMCKECSKEIKENEQGYYYCVTNGFCMWCAGNGTRVQ
jgi:hypothetical protein